MNREIFFIRIRIGVACLVCGIFSLGFLATVEADAVIDFNELSTWTSSGPTGSYYNGNRTNVSNSEGWSTGAGPTAYFGNQYSSDWGGFWSGFAYSNVNDRFTSGHLNQYAAITGTGFGGSGNYAIGHSGQTAFLNLPSGWHGTSLQVTNTTYAANSMRNGDSFAKKFGGLSGNDPDYFLITFTGYDGLDGTGSVTGTLDFYLADFRFADNSRDYILDQWTSVNLSPLGAAASIRLSFSGSDVGAFGLNTPTYVAIDHLRISSVPEPASGLGWVLIGWLSLRRQRGPRANR
ncbi:MAG: DUF4465 domain-containing protein [Planctomycetaceae bacterium]|nr:DUF4465 domain-containing protein [Planctomycetaceae bacterium]